MEEKDQTGLYYNRDIRPIPDPTVLTTQQLMRELAALRELLEERLNGMDKAIALAQHIADGIPGLITLHVHHLRDVHAERFQSIQQQFAERDQQAKQAVEDNKNAMRTSSDMARDAVRAAFDAAKEAARETKDSFTKQIDQLSTLLRTMTDATNEKVAIQDRRLTIIEGRSSGMSSSWAIIVGGIGVAGVLLSITMALLNIKH